MAAIPKIIDSLGWKVLFSDTVIGRVQVKVHGILGSQRLFISIDKIEDNTSKVNVSTEMSIITWDSAQIRETLDKLHSALDSWASAR